MIHFKLAYTKLLDYKTSLKTIAYLK